MGEKGRAIRAALYIQMNKITFMGLRTDINKTIEDKIYFRNYFINFTRLRILQLYVSKNEN